MGLESISYINSYNNVYQNYADKPKSTKPPINKDTKITFVDPKTGKKYSMTYEEYLKFIYNEYNKNKPKPPTANPYELGPEKNGVRTINPDNVTESTKPGSTAPKDFAQAPEKYQDYKNNIADDNGIIDNFRQGKRGDCYLLASIEAIKQTDDGQEILKKNVQANPDGSYTITLPGAVLARNHYIEIGEGAKCAITGKYTITKEAVEKARSQAGKAYSFGDINVILFELAMEAFRAEVTQTNQALGQKSEKYIAGQFGPVNTNDPLSGGQMYDAVFILTGQKSDVYEAKREKKENCKPYIPGEYGYVGEKKKLLKEGRIGSSKEDLIEVNNVYNKDSDLQRMLDCYKGKEGEYCITVGFRVAQKGPDGTTQAGGGHALTVTKITDQYVEVVNPWDTSKAERIPRGDFEKMAINLTVTPMKKENVDKFYEEKVDTKKQTPSYLNSIKQFFSIK